MRSAVVLALLAAGATGAWAAKLDKTACNDLSTELAGATAAGVKGDMERGPDWAKSNLPPERLASIQRMIEVQEQLEFRCGTRAKGAKEAPTKPGSPGAKDDAPGVKVEAPAGKAVEQPTPLRLDGKADTAVSPRAAENRPQVAPVAPTPAILSPAVTAKSVGVPPAASASAAHAEAANAPAAASAATPLAVNPVTTKPAAAPVVAANPSAGGPPVTKLAPLIPAAGGPPGSPPVTKLAPLSPTAAGQAALSPAGIQSPVTPGAAPLKKPSDPAAQALGSAAIRKKPSRRDSTSTYVAPNEVTPYALSGYGSER